MPPPQGTTHAYDNQGPAGPLMCTDWCVRCVAFVWINLFSFANFGRHNFVQISTLWWRLVNLNVAPGVYIEPTVTTSRRESCFSVQLDCIPFQRSIAHRLIFMCSVHKGTLYKLTCFPTIALPHVWSRTRCGLTDHRQLFVTCMYQFWSFYEFTPCNFSSCQCCPNCA